MNEFELQTRVQASLKTWVATIMSQNGVPNLVMMNAIQSVLGDVKDAAYQEYLAALDMAKAEPPEEKAEE